MKTRDMIIIAVVVMLLSFPLIYIIMLLATGNAKLVTKGDLSRMVEHETVSKMQKISDRRDSLIVEKSYAFEANADETKRLETEKERVLREQERLNFLISELQSEREKLEAEKIRFEKAVSETKEGNAKKAVDLARVYQAMKPKEAAQIMETLSDNLCIDILKAMNDDRQKAKILAAMEIEKATRLSQKMGMKNTTKANF
jgi:flagellar motility protein MotE (MotC chaperone)